ncbi:MAG: tetratricopeptide repeat protein [Armatimonadetes bacterium]|nr:tetratricopeptide repeat protein [Armatimonadota bacterium]
MAGHADSEVTFLFTDIQGSTRLWESHAQAMAAALPEHEARLRQAVEAAGGIVFKTLGDGLCAAFTEPADALRAALDGQRALRAVVWPDGLELPTRMALSRGPAELRDGDYFGSPLNRAARLLAVAQGDQVLLAELAVPAVPPDGVTLRDLGRHRLRDFRLPERIFQLVHADLPDDRRRPLSLDEVPNNLPVPADDLVGRQRELNEVASLLRAGRLVTLTGVGGTGKTRLALAVAAEQLVADGDGIWLTELAAVADPDLVAGAVATSLGLKEEPGRDALAAVTAHLAGQSALLVLDNCEHVIHAAALLAEALLRGCPALRVLVTSREALGIAGEVTYPVPSLGLDEAVELLARRAAAVSPGFVLSEANREAAAEVCRRLDGIPLALELAAARVRSMTLPQLAQRLDQRFRLLTGGSRTALPRQRTLQALIDWSYDLLDADERQLLARLSVFAGGWPLEAVAAVCGDGDEDWELLDRLAGLVDKSLVVHDDETGRDRLLETVRQYAAERLLEQGGVEQVRDRHLGWCLELARRAEPPMGGDEGLRRLDDEQDNLRAALAWCDVASAGAALGLALAGLLGWYWAARGMLAEGRQQLEQALARDGGAPLDRARARNELGILCRLLGDAPAARGQQLEALACYRDLGDRRGEVVALANLGILAIDQRELAEARGYLEETQRLSAEVGDRHVQCALLNNLASVLYDTGDLASAEHLLGESVAIAEQEGDQGTLAAGLANLGLLALRRGDTEAATTLYRRSLALRVALGHRAGYPEVLEGLAMIAADSAPERAARLVGAATALRRELAMPLPERWQRDLDEALAPARAVLGERWVAHVAEGGGLAADEALDLAVS